MALASDQLNMRRSAMLLACQRGRESRRRIEVLRAEQARASAMAAEISAREHRDTHVALCGARLTAAHEAVRGRMIDLDELKTLIAVEQSLKQQAIAAETDLAEARENRQKADLALAEAASRLGSEVKLTRKRERLADQMLATWHQATEAAAEAEAEDQVADNWNAA